MDSSGRWEGLYIRREQSELWPELGEEDKQLLGSYVMEQLLRTTIGCEEGAV
jgi:hypothetical protein